MLTQAEKRILKAKAQLLEPVVRLGHDGASEAFYQALDAALTLHKLVKVKFTGLKEEKKQLAPVIAEHSRSEVVMRVGNVLVLHRG